MLFRTIAIAACMAIAAFTAAPAHAQNAGSPAEIETGQPVTIGVLTISRAWARATPPGAVTGAGYMTITNEGQSDDRLIAIRSERAQFAEIHQMTMDGDRMTMRPVENGLSIPAGESIILPPGGLHVMLVELDEAIAVSEPVAITLVFELAGEITIMLEVYPIGSPGPDGADGGMDAMDGMSEGGS